MDKSISHMDALIEALLDASEKVIHIPFPLLFLACLVFFLGILVPTIRQDRHLRPKKESSVELRQRMRRLCRLAFLSLFFVLVSSYFAPNFDGLKTGWQIAQFLSINGVGSIAGIVSFLAVVQIIDPHE